MSELVQVWQEHLGEQDDKSKLELYVVVETSAHFDLDFLAELYANEPLFPEEVMEDDTPHVYHIPQPIQQNDFLQDLLQVGLGKNAVCFILSDLSTQDLLSQLRRYTKVRDENNDRHWLRFWDARVASSFIKNLNVDEHINFFNGIHQIMLEDYRNPENILVFATKDKPEPQEQDKPNTWDETGYMLLRPDLQQKLMDGYADYYSYALANKLICEYPQKTKQDISEVERWVQEQNSYCLSRDDSDDIEIKENFITAAWLTQCTVEELPKYLDLPMQDRHIRVFDLSETALEQAIIKIQTSHEKQA